MNAVPPSDAVLWHDLECAGYAADLILWRALAGTAAGPVLEVGAGTGRVALDLARHGSDVTALDADPVLLDALSARARERGLTVETVAADARTFGLGRRFALCLLPMQTIQLLEGPAGRAAFLARAREHLLPGGLLAAALADPLEGFDAEHTEPPLPDLREEAGFLFASQPVAVRSEPGAFAIERIRQTVAPDGRRTSAAAVVRLDRLTATELEEEAAAAGLHPAGRRRIDATAEHVGSEVVVLGA